jgi:hypothetical protein
MANYVRLEITPTGRSNCQECKLPIEINQVRLRLGWKKGAKYFHPVCAVKDHWFNLLSASKLHNAPSLDDDVINS